MKLGIIGTGMIVNEVLTFIHDMPDIELVHISGTQRSEAKVKDLQQKHGFQRYSLQYEDLLEDQEVDTIYVAVPNHLHYTYAKQALKANKHVIVEKPFTSTIEEARDLQKLAQDAHLFLWEAITNQYSSSFHRLHSLLGELGDIKLVTCNFSQRSSRYQAFQEGTILPAFDPQKSGGALMDINIYNIHFVVGLFGKPQEVIYYPRIEKGIDTSGVLVLTYPTMTCVCVGAKDCQAPSHTTIQGDQQCVYISTPVSGLSHFEVLQGHEKTFSFEGLDVHRMWEEFAAFQEMYAKKDYQRCYTMLAHSLDVVEVQTIARRKAGILFPADQQYVG